MQTDLHAASSSDLPRELAQPARRALVAAGITRLEQLTQRRAAEIQQLHGMGPKAMRQLRRSLAAHGWAFVGETPATDAA
jgi:hypothetical protein